jgi:predicted GNAT family acetyltransferase
MEMRLNEAENRYEFDAPHGLAVVVYRQQDDKLFFVHSEVPPADEGTGIGAQVVKAAVEDATRRGFSVVPVCSFVAAQMRRHPEWAKR